MLGWGVLGKSPASRCGEWFAGAGHRVVSRGRARDLLKKPLAVMAVCLLFADSGRCLGVLAAMGIAFQGRIGSIRSASAPCFLAGYSP